MPVAPACLERAEQPDDVGRVDHSVHGVHAVARQRQHGRRVEAGEEADRCPSGARRARSASGSASAARRAPSASTSASSATARAAARARARAGPAARPRSAGSVSQLAQAVLAQRLAARDEVGDRLGGAERRGELDRAAEIGMKVAGTPSCREVRAGRGAGTRSRCARRRARRAVVHRRAAGAASASRQPRSRAAAARRARRRTRRPGSRRRCRVDGAVLDQTGMSSARGEQDLGVLVGERHAQAAAVGLEVEAGVVQQPRAGSAIRPFDGSAIRSGRISAAAPARRSSTIR